MLFYYFTNATGKPEQVDAWAQIVDVGSRGSALKAYSLCVKYIAGDFPASVVNNIVYT